MISLLSTAPQSRLRKYLCLHYSEGVSVITDYIISAYLLMSSSEAVPSLLAGVLFRRAEINSLLDPRITRGYLES